MTRSRAFVVEAHGAPQEALRLREVEVGSPGPGEVVIDVGAFGVNFPDALLVTGEYQDVPPLPFVPGSECSGTIAAVGDGVEGLEVGDLVVAVPLGGCFAERARVRAERVFRRPSNLSEVDGAGFLVTHGTMWHALMDRGRLRAGESVLVLGAAGGIGLASIAVAKAAGATAIAVVSSAEKARLARTAGADHVLLASEGELKQRVASLTNGAGADVLVDPVGGDAFREGIRCLAWRGRALIIGFASGEIPELRVNRLLLQGSEAIGVYWGRASEVEPERFRADVEQLLAAVERGELRPLPVTAVPFAATPELLQELFDRRRAGKFAAVVGNGPSEANE